MINHKVLKRDLFRTGFEICTTVSLNWAMPLESNETIHSCSIENQNYEISCADAEILEISCSEPDQFLLGENFSVSFYSFLPTSTLQWKNWMYDYGIQHSLLWWIKLIFFFPFFCALIHAFMGYCGRKSKTGQTIEKPHERKKWSSWISYAVNWPRCQLLWNNPTWLKRQIRQSAIIIWWMIRLS